MDAGMLHVKARRYLMERYERLCQRYAALPDGGRAEDGYHYSPRAVQIFPRYHVVQAILVEVERLDPDRLPDVLPLVAVLGQAGATAQSVFTQPPYGQVEAEAMADERRRFASAVQTWMVQPDLTVEPVGYRRVLAPDESSSWLRRLSARWGVQHRSWHPMIDGAIPGDVLVLHEDALSEGGGVERVRELVRQVGCDRVAELREFGPDYLLDVSMFTPSYAGTEGVWSDEGLSWIAFASHEGTVAFGGLLATGLSKTWPGLERWRWHPAA